MTEAERDALADAAIPLGARILGVADAFVALNTSGELGSSAVAAS